MLVKGPQLYWQVCSTWLNGQYVIIVSGDSSVPNRRHAFIWINGDPVSNAYIRLNEWDPLCIPYEVCVWFLNCHDTPAPVWAASIGDVLLIQGGVYGIFRTQTQQPVGSLREVVPNANINPFWVISPIQPVGTYQQCRAPFTNMV